MVESYTLSNTVLSFNITEEKRGKITIAKGKKKKIIIGNLLYMH